MLKWAILSGIEGNLVAYEAVLQDIYTQQQPVTDLFILGDVINYRSEGLAVVERIQKPRSGELTPQVCRGWWEEQYLLIHGFLAETMPNPVIAKYGAATAKAMWDQVPKSVVQWMAELDFAFVELDCLLVHGSSLSTTEELTPESSPLQILDRFVRSNVNRLFCGRSGRQFHLQVQGGSVSSEVVRMDGSVAKQTDRSDDRALIGVGNVGRNPHCATYTLYYPSTDKLEFRQVAHKY